MGTAITDYKDNLMKLDFMQQDIANRVGDFMYETPGMFVAGAGTKEVNGFYRKMQPDEGPPGHWLGGMEGYFNTHNAREKRVCETCGKNIPNGAVLGNCPTPGCAGELTWWRE